MVIYKITLHTYNCGMAKKNDIILLFSQKIIFGVFVVIKSRTNTLENKHYSF